jgi:pimeloyl-ACP methyl ester carboxylesterase
MELGSVELAGILDLPRDPVGLILFAHGSGSGRLSTRNNFVAGKIRQSGFGTLLFDLLTPKEAEDRRNVFDIGLLSSRLLAARAWAGRHPGVEGLGIGYFGASTGAAAAIRASADDPAGIVAIVSRGGRPDMASDCLGRVMAPTLLIVGGYDDLVLELNREAFGMMKCEKELVVVPGATHLFEEPGKMEEVALLAERWFSTHFKK